jgi:FG-GAP repeat
VFSGRTGALVFTLVSPTAEELPSFGSAVAGGKDVSHDGIPDFAVGAPLQNSLQGAVYIFSGADGKLQRNLQAGTATFAKFGSSIAFSDDLTGDNRPDVLVGAPDQAVGDAPNAGEAFIFNGANGRLFKTIGII